MINVLLTHYFDICVQQYASSLVMRLQLAIQEVNSALEETSQQVGAELHPCLVLDMFLVQGKKRHTNKHPGERIQ